MRERDVSDIYLRSIIPGTLYDAAVCLPLLTSVTGMRLVPPVGDSTVVVQVVKTLALRCDRRRYEHRHEQLLQVYVAPYHQDERNWSVCTPPRPIFFSNRIWTAHINPPPMILLSWPNEYLFQPKHAPSTYVKPSTYVCMHVNYLCHR